MDLNPQIPNWTYAGGPFEIADHCVSKKSNLLILLNAWLDSGAEIEEKHDWQTLNYWAARTKPLWSNGNDSDSDNDSDSSAKEQDIGKADSNETLVVICNRSGQENGETHIFSSLLKLIVFYRENIRWKLGHL